MGAAVDVRAGRRAAGGGVDGVDRRRQLGVDRRRQLAVDKRRRVIRRRSAQRDFLEAGDGGVAAAAGHAALAASAPTAVVVQPDEHVRIAAVRGGGRVTCAEGTQN